MRTEGCGSNFRAVFFKHADRALLWFTFVLIMSSIIVHSYDTHFQESRSSDNVSCEILAYLHRPQCIKQIWVSHCLILEVGVNKCQALKQHDIWGRSRNCGCLVAWFWYQLIAKPGNKIAAVSWPDPYISLQISSCPKFLIFVNN